MSNSANAFTVLKQVGGGYRWVGITATSYMDREGEIITSKALALDVLRGEFDGRLGPLRLYHIGVDAPEAWDEPDGEPWGVGLDIGDCDWRMAAGPFLLESGTFWDDRVAEAIATAGPLEFSIGYHYYDSDVSWGSYGETLYQRVLQFERSLVPYGEASNMLTAAFISGGDMARTNAERLAELEGLLGADTMGTILEVAEQKGAFAGLMGLAVKIKDGEAAADEPKTGDTTDATPNPTPTPTPTPDATPTPTPTPDAAPDTTGDAARENVTDEPKTGESNTNTNSPPTSTTDDPGASQDTITLADVRATVAEAVRPIIALLEASGAQAVAATKATSETATSVKAVSDRLGEVETSLKELRGEMPSGVRYRASQAKETVVKGSAQGSVTVPADPWLDNILESGQPTPPA